MRFAQVQGPTRWRFSRLGLRYVVAMGAAGELALQRVDLFEMRIARGDGGGQVRRGMLTFSYEHGESGR